jgi:hypothetical protein
MLALYVCSHDALEVKPILSGTGSLTASSKAIPASTE